MKSIDKKHRTSNYLQSDLALLYVQLKEAKVTYTDAD